MSMPKQKPGRSRQDYATPWELVDAVNSDLLFPSHYSKITMDLASTQEASKAPWFVSPEDDSLSLDWGTIINEGTAWLNPPFSRIRPWAAKCAETFPWVPGNQYKHKGLIVLLTPASVGANWFAEFVWPHAVVCAVRPRITFVGETHPYIKDCIISIFGTGVKEAFTLWSRQAPQLIKNSKKEIAP